MKNDIMPLSIPVEGEKSELILQRIREMKEADIAWKDGKVWSLVYYANDEHDQLLKAANSELFSGNYLNPLAFKSLHRMEQEVVRMTADMLHGDDETVGVMTTGGTESILLAMFCYRQRARKLHPHITNPEVILPQTIHPAFDKAAVLFGLHLRKAPVDDNRCVLPGAMEDLINENTILLVASSPSYPNGVMDPIETIAGIAQRHHLPFHVDACIGGFMLPWVEKLGYPVAAWDYRVAGVTSISADVHKFGFGPKGTSVLTYRSIDYLRHQFVVTTDYPGGIYISPTLLGTRAGGPIAAAWAGMHHLGKNGYMALAKQLMEATQKLRAGLSAIPGITVLGEPCMNLVSFTTVNNQPDIFIIADQLEDKGWMVERQQSPDCIHLTVLPTNAGVIDEYLSDLKAAQEYAVSHPGAVAKGNAAVYGLMARIPFRGMVEKSVKKIMEDMYGIEDLQENEAEKHDHAVAESPVWMGFVNRLLSAWTTWRQGFKKTPLHFWIMLCTVMALTIPMKAQPFVDPFQVRYMYAFSNNQSEVKPVTHLWAGSDLPIKLKENAYLLLSPYYEHWQTDLVNNDQMYPVVRSLALPVGLIWPLGKSKWSLTLMPTLRTNGEKLFAANTLQYGGASLITYSRKAQQNFRLGVYVNREFFGWFVVPLLGVDWRLNEKDYLFGILPGRLTYEHQWSKILYGGATFRAPTSSFRLDNGQYLRIDDNQLSLYLDYYATKHICLTLESGYGIFRRLRTGVEERVYLTKDKWSESPFVKLSASYRIRL